MIHSTFLLHFSGSILSQQHMGNNLWGIFPWCHNDHCPESYPLLKVSSSYHSKQYSWFFSSLWALSRLPDTPGPASSPTIEYDCTGHVLLSASCSLDSKSWSLIKSIHFTSVTPCSFYSKEKSWSVPFMHWTHVFFNPFKCHPACACCRKIYILVILCMKLVPIGNNMFMV